MVAVIGAGKVASIGKPLVKYRKQEQNISGLKGGEFITRFGFVAATYHFLRIHDYPDPSTSNDEKTWHRFVAWIDDRLTEEGVFERCEAWADARTEYFTSATQLSGAFRFGARLLLSGHAVLLILEKIFGSSLPKRLAQEWMNQA